ncbi:TIGR01777 family oxidoreductase [Rapidithrix thailandica]|uniref:TIGR01777 family oxidoreductase n=1 Tax=Rapidithrix thailandica TaxID=413964 RepID=A0AAW9S7Y7_9BACT
MKQNVLITGGTGLVGTYLTRLLLKKGFRVSHLSRSRHKHQDIEYYLWNIGDQFIEEGAIEDADYIIHLAGASIGEKRWTPARKQELRDSRVLSTKLLAQRLTTASHKVKAFIAASAIGIYGDTGNQWATEESKPGSGFLANLCKEWESKIDLIADLGIRTVKIRSGIVLSKKGGVLEQMALPVKLFAGTPLGNGKQYFPWIHIEDISQMFLYAIENESLVGPFNGVAPNPVTNTQFTKALGKILCRPVWPIGVPPFVLNIALGEMASTALESSRISAKKIQEAGFHFSFKTAQEALKDLFKG